MYTIYDRGLMLLYYYSRVRDEPNMMKCGNGWTDVREKNLGIK